MRLKEFQQAFFILRSQKNEGDHIDNVSKSWKNSEHSERDGGCASFHGVTTPVKVLQDKDTGRYEVQENESRNDHCGHEKLFTKSDLVERSCMFCFLSL